MELELDRVVAVQVWLCAMEAAGTIVCWTVVLQRPRVHSSLLPSSQLVKTNWTLLNYSRTMTFYTFQLLYVYVCSLLTVSTRTYLQYKTFIVICTSHHVVIYNSLLTKYFTLHLMEMFNEIQYSWHARMYLQSLLKFIDHNIIELSLNTQRHNSVI